MILIDKIKGLFKKDEQSINISMNAVETNSIHYKVAGVSYNNDDGESRQKILKKVKVNDRLKFFVCEYENKPAIAVLTETNKQIGFVKSGNVNRTIKHINKGGYAVVYKCQKSIDLNLYYCIYELK